MIIYIVNFFNTFLERMLGVRYGLNRKPVTYELNQKNKIHLLMFFQF